MPANGDAAMVEANVMDGDIRKITMACTCDSGDGSFSKALNSSFEGILVRLVTNPGATTPSDNYDVALNDASGIDLLEGLGANRDASTTESVAILSNGVVAAVDDTDDLTLVFSNNTVVSAVVECALYYKVP